MADDGLFGRIRFRGEPIADRRGVIVAGAARFTLLTDRLIRMEWSPGGCFDDRGSYAFPTRLAPVPPFRQAQASGELTIETAALRLCYRLGCGFEPGSLSACAQPLREGAPPACAGEWQPGSPAAGNLRGTRRTLDVCEGDATLDEGLLSRDGWVLFDDSRSARFDPAGWVAPAADPPYLDWYLFGYGRDYKGALADYARFGGAIPLIPRFVLGAWWSRYWAYSDRDLKRLVRDFERHRFPLDVLVVDMDWHTPDAWTGYTWNRRLFPDPAGFLAWVHKKGLRATLNLHPAQGVQPFEEVYAAFARSLGLDPVEGQPVPFRISDPAFVKSYFELLHHPLEEQGVDFWWVDWQQGGASEMKGLDPLPWLNHLHFSDSRRRGGRPILYSRWGGLGNHRYPIGFSGDTYVTWSALQFQPYLTATAANVAYGWWSHDIGGHMGGATEPELYARWVQFGALSPVLRLHATKDARAERRPWAYPRRVCRAARAAFRLRYQLIPYLYTMARAATDTGLSPCRPIYYEHPEEEAAYAARYQYYLGDQMIAAPIVHPADPATGLAAADVWIPPGAWTDWTTLERFCGPGWVRIVGGIDRIPLLVRAGGIVPLAGTLQPATAPHLSSGTTASLPAGSLTLAVLPGEEGSFRLYEDDGSTEGYRDGEFEWTPIASRMPSPERWQVCVGAAEGQCAALPRARRVEIRLMGSRQPESVTVAGQPDADWSYDAATLTTTIRVGEHDRYSALEVSASCALGMDALGEDHNLRLMRADAARLLGMRRSRRAAGASRAELLEMALHKPCPGQADAIARLGGPLVRIVEHAGIDQARESLGRVIVGAPRGAGETFDVEAWIGMEPQPGAAPGAVDAIHCRRPCNSGDLILHAPPAPLRPMRTDRWQAEVRIGWRGVTLAQTYRSGALFPTVHAWQCLGAGEEGDAGSWEQVFDSSGAPRPERAWIAMAQGVEGPINVYEPHLLQLGQLFAAEARAGRSPAAYLATAVSSPFEQEAVLQLRAPGPIEVRLNGREVRLEPGEYEGRIHPRLRPTRRSEPLLLRAGENYLAVRSRPAQGGRWIVGASLTSAGDEVLVNLRYRLPCDG